MQRAIAFYDQLVSEIPEKNEEFPKIKHHFQILSNF